MIFIGDISHPFETPPQLPRIAWSDQYVVANLEGAIIGNSQHPKKALYNHESVIDYLLALKTKAVCLSNNHITDFRHGIPSTIETLNSNGISTFGAGVDREQALSPALIEEDGIYNLILGFGWEVIQCKRATNDRAGVAPLEKNLILSTIKKHRESVPNSRLIVNFHWNYELETHPQPAHRQLARDSIDAGADIIIGHHPHCPSGIETYKGKVIAYSLGNWWIPHNVYFDGRLKYPSFTNLQLALEWNPRTSSSFCHWYTYDPRNHTLTYLESSPSEECRIIKALTPYNGFSHRAYLTWFEDNKSKGRLLPTYRNINNALANCLKDKFVALRQPIIEVLRRVIKK